MTNQEETILDQGKTLSKSRLWDLQYAIYDYYGPQAWTQAGVPFYMTSNPYTVRQYAKMALGYLRDCVHGTGSPSWNPSQPFYVFDLGAGTGRFGYLFLRELDKYLALARLGQVQLRYVMTDMIASNLQYLRHHPYLQEMIQRGTIDFAHYHTSFDKQTLQLLTSQQELHPEAIANPLVVIGNYFFDVIPQDLFKVCDGQLYEGLPTIISKQKIDALHPHPSQLKSLAASYHYRPVEQAAYYEDELQEAILRSYQATFDGVPFTIPVAAFQVLRYFNWLSSGRMLLLAGDQGMCNEQQIREAGEPVVSLQGGISMAVSYHALAQYVRLLGGAAWLTAYPNPLFVVIAAALGGREADFKETSLAYEDSFDYFQPSDYWKLTCCSEQEWENPSLEYLLLLIKLGHWDPINFYAFFTAIRSQIHEATETTKALLAATIRQVWEHFYPVGKEEGDFVMNLGVLLFELHLPAEALLFFERSLHVGGEKAQIYHNMAACYMLLKRPDEALAAMLKAKACSSS